MNRDEFYDALFHAEDHKYIQKVGNRYFYSQEEYDAYMKKGNVEKAIDDAADWNRNLAKSILAKGSKSSGDSEEESSTTKFGEMTDYKSKFFTYTSSGKSAVDSSSTTSETVSSATTSSSAKKNIASAKDFMINIQSDVAGQSISGLSVNHEVTN